MSEIPTIGEKKEETLEEKGKRVGAEINAILAREGLAFKVIESEPQVVLAPNDKTA